MRTLKRQLASHKITISKLQINIFWVRSCSTEDSEKQETNLKELFESTGQLESKVWNRFGQSFWKKVAAAEETKKAIVIEIQFVAFRD